MSEKQTIYIDNDATNVIESRPPTSEGDIDLYLDARDVYSNAIPDLVADLVKNQKGRYDDLESVSGGSEVSAHGLSLLQEHADEVATSPYLKAMLKAPGTELDRLIPGSDSEIPKYQADAITATMARTIDEIMTQSGGDPVLQYLYSVKGCLRFSTGLLSKDHSHKERVNPRNMNDPDYHEYRYGLSVPAAEAVGLVVTTLIEQRRMALEDWHKERFETFVAAEDTVNDDELEQVLEQNSLSPEELAHFAASAAKRVVRETKDS